MREYTHDQVEIDDAEWEERAGSVAVRLVVHADGGPRRAAPPEPHRPLDRWRSRSAPAGSGRAVVVADPAPTPATTAPARTAARQAPVRPAAEAPVRTAAEPPVRTAAEPPVRTATEEANALRTATPSAPSAREPFGGRVPGSSTAGRPLRLLAAGEPGRGEGHPGTLAPRSGEWLRRAAAGLAVALAAAALVIGLGRLADTAAQLRTQSAPAAGSAARAPGIPGPAGTPGAREITVTVRAAGTVWDVVDEVAPGVSGPQRAAMVEGVVAANTLSSLRVWPGQVLRVPRRI